MKNKKMEETEGTEYQKNFTELARLLIDYEEEIKNKEVPFQLLQEFITWSNPTETDENELVDLIEEIFELLDEPEGEGEYEELYNKIQLLKNLLK